MARKVATASPAPSTPPADAPECELGEEAADYVVTEVGTGEVRCFCTYHLLETIADIITTAAMTVGAQAAAEGHPL